MKKTLTIVFGVIVAVTIGLAITAQTPTPEPSEVTAVIKFKACPAPDEHRKAMVEHTRYEVEGGGTVVFRNRSNVRITLTFHPQCALFEDQTPINLPSGGTTERIVIQEPGEGECRTLLAPDCREAGPIIVPEP